MTSKRIIAPVEGLNGPGVGGLIFENSVAETDNHAIIAYCESAGYTVEDIQPGHVTATITDDTTWPDPSVETGAPLRDAAVDPHPDDHLPPTNAGLADPHGPAVVSPEIPDVAPPLPGPPDLENATRAELVTIAKAHGLRAPKTANKGQLLESIRAAMSPGSDAQDGDTDDADREA